MTGTLQRVPLEVSIHWRYLHQMQGKLVKQGSRHIKKGISGLAVDKRNGIKGILCEKD